LPERPCEGNGCEGIGYMVILLFSENDQHGLIAGVPGS